VKAQHPHPLIATSRQTTSKRSSSLRPGSAAPDAYAEVMRRKTLAMIFMKPSTRTRVSFEAGSPVGGQAIYLTPKRLPVGRDETVADTRPGALRSATDHGTRLRPDRWSTTWPSTRPCRYQRASPTRPPGPDAADLFTRPERFPDRRKLTMVTSGDGKQCLPLADARRGQERPVDPRRSAPTATCPTPDIIQQARDDARRPAPRSSHQLLAPWLAPDVVYPTPGTSMGPGGERGPPPDDLHDYQVERGR